MESYVNELGKRNIILLNKSDFLTEQQREHWATFFESISLPYAFYSAATANEKLSSKGEDSSSNKTSLSETEHSESDSETGDDEEEDMANEDEDNGEVGNPTKNDTIKKYSVLGREALITFLKAFRQGTDADLFSVGLVGYPNVGKSSTINSLMGIKRTSVSATPGKTKHFQVLHLKNLTYWGCKMALTGFKVFINSSQHQCFF